MSEKRLLKLNIYYGIIFKILNIITTFIMIPIVISYLGVEKYGLWVTLFSVTSWIYMFDGGIGNGLKVNLIKSISEKKDELAKKYIANSYLFMFLLCFAVLIITFPIIYTVDLNKVFSVDFLHTDDLRNIIIIMLAFTISTYFLSLYKNLLFSINNVYLVNLSIFLYQLFALCFILVIRKYDDASLFYIAIAYGLSNMMVSFIFTLYFFIKNKKLIPSYKDFNVKIFKESYKLGFDFFIIQISSIVIYSSDNIIISNKLGPEYVTSYSLVFQVYTVGLVFWYIISNTVGPLLAKNYYSNNIDGVRKIIKNMNIIFFIIIVALIVSVYAFPLLINVWVKDNIIYPEYIFFFFAVFVAMRIYGDIYMSFLNSIGIIKWQKYLSIFGAVLNIPISIFLAVNLDLKSSGVILGTCFSIFGLTLIMPIIGHKVIREMSHDKS